MEISFYEDTIEGACGVSNFYNFYPNFWDANPQNLPTKLNGEADFAFAGFINEPNCHKAYEALCSKYKLVYQSPVRKNRNSNHDFFFCIFDARK